MQHGRRQEVGAGERRPGGAGSGWRGRCRPPRRRGRRRPGSRRRSSRIRHPRRPAAAIRSPRPWPSASTARRRGRSGSCPGGPRGTWSPGSRRGTASSRPPAIDNSPAVAVILLPAKRTTSTESGAVRRDDGCDREDAHARRERREVQVELEELGLHEQRAEQREDPERERRRRRREAAAPGRTRGSASDGRCVPPRRRTRRARQDRRPRPRRPSSTTSRAWEPR